MRDIIRMVSFMLSIFVATTLISQSIEKVQLLDQETYLPIEGAYFEYGSQSGVSDENGMIQFTLEPDLSMTLSHLTYGNWELDENSILTMIKQGYYYRSSQEVNLYPVTIIAVKTNQTPSDKISLKHWDRMAHDGASVLNQSAAFNSIRKSGGYGFDPVFRGFKYDQLNVVMNGAQSATAACPNRMDPPTSQMAPNMMDRIEVLKGPYALRYGTGFGGTINFIQSSLRFADESDLYGRASSGFESNGNIFRNEGQLGISGKVYDFSVFGSWSQGDDYKTGNDQTVQSDFNRGSFGANLGLKLTANQQLRLSSVYNRSRDADFAALPMDLRDDDTWLFNARHDIQLDRGKLESWNTTVFASVVSHKMDNLLKVLEPRMMNASTDANTYNYGGRTESIWRLGSNSLFAGADLRIEGASGTRAREFLMGPMAGMSAEDNVWQDGQISKSGLFGEYHWKRTGYQVVVSGRVEANTATISDVSTEFAQIYNQTEVTQINPNVSVGVSKTLGKSSKLGLWAGRVQRSGSLTERFINYFPVGQDPYEIIGNPDVKPEVNNQVDLTYGWSTPNMALDIDVFAAYLQDFISSRIDASLTPRLPASPGVRRVVNIDQAFKSGFEINYTQQLVAGLKHQLGVAYTYAQDLELDQPLPEIAPLDLRYSLNGSYFEGKLQPSASLRHVMKQDRISTEYGETVTPAFTLLDVAVSYDITPVIRFTTGVNNLLNETYYEHLNRSVSATTSPIYARGRNVSFSLNVNF